MPSSVSAGHCLAIWSTLCIGLYCSVVLIPFDSTRQREAAGLRVDSLPIIPSKCKLMLPMIYQLSVFLTVDLTTPHLFSSEFQRASSGWAPAISTSCARSAHSTCPTAPATPLLSACSLIAGQCSVKPTLTQPRLSHKHKGVTCTVLTPECSRG